MEQDNTTSQAIYILNGENYTQEELEKYANDNGLALHNEWSGELEWCLMVNPENHQHRIEAIVDNGDAEYEKAKCELVLTTQYHNWSDSCADKIMKILENEREDDGWKEEAEFSDCYKNDIDNYNKSVEAFNEYGDALTISNEMELSNIETIIINNSGQTR